MSNILYNSIGSGYNTTRCADSYLAERFYKLLSVPEGGLCLDIGCGTGNYTMAMHKMGLKMIGLDPSDKMLQEAVLHSSAINWMRGSAEELPLPQAHCDGVMGMLTIHHWTDLNASFAELSRVLKKNGKIVFFTSSPDQMKGYWLNHYFPGMMQQSSLQMPSLNKILAAAANAGLQLADTETYFVKDDLQDHFLYVGKCKPELYFDDRIRNGISSFAAIAHADEVQAGMVALRNDINNHTFPEILKRYENDMGDYLFVVLKKTN